MFFRETDCAHRVPGIDAETESEACTKCGAERRWTVPAEIVFDEIANVADGICPIASYDGACRRAEPHFHIYRWTGSGTDE